MIEGRSEAFSNDVLAITVTNMILKLRIPEGETFQDVKPSILKLLSYIFSFIYVEIYFNNHHHLFRQ